MHKAIQLKAQFALVGAGGPPPTPEASAQIVRDVLGAGHWRHPRLSVALKALVAGPPASDTQQPTVVATLWIEGQAAPADDFAQYSGGALREIVGAGRWRHPLVAISVLDVAEAADDADDA